MPCNIYNFPSVYRTSMILVESPWFVSNRLVILITGVISFAKWQTELLIRRIICHMRTIPHEIKSLDIVEFLLFKKKFFFSKHIYELYIWFYVLFIYLIVLVYMSRF